MRNRPWRRSFSCTDVVIRAYRKLGIDLQARVHDDMVRAFAAYPRRWGQNRTDTNIDHRRVPNLRVFFTRQGSALPASAVGRDYQPGDLVTWDLRASPSSGCCTTSDTLPHIGIVAGQLSADGQRPLIVHNIGGGQVMEDMLFTYKITGHYRYLPAR